MSRNSASCSTQPSSRSGSGLLRSLRAAFLTLLFAFALLPPLQAATFNCSSGDAACLAQAITAANATAKADTIRLAAGVYTLPAEDNTEDGANGLPSITSKIKIKGKGSDQTIIQRDPSSDRDMRIVHVGATGNLTLEGVTLRGGFSFDSLHQNATGIFNRGTTHLIDSVVSENVAIFGPAGILNVGTMTIVDSIVANNLGIDGASAGGIVNAGGMRISGTTIDHNCGESSGGIFNGGILEITDSAISRNTAGVPAGGGGGVSNSGTMTLTNTTIVENGIACSLATPFAAADPPLVLGGRAIYNFGGVVTVKSSTIARNVPDLVGFATGGIFNAFGSVEIENTILALNDSDELPGDCFTDSGAIISLGSNLIGDATGCNIVLLQSDLTGDPGLEDYADDGTPGNGHLPLHADSSAIDSGDQRSCPKRDQLGNRRKKPCDIGAVEFQKRPAKTRGRP